MDLLHPFFGALNFSFLVVSFCTAEQHLDLNDSTGTRPDCTPTPTLILWTTLPPRVMSLCKKTIMHHSWFAQTCGGRSERQHPKCRGKTAPVAITRAPRTRPCNPNGSRTTVIPNHGMLHLETEGASKKQNEDVVMLLRARCCERPVDAARCPQQRHSVIHRWCTCIKTGSLKVAK